MNTQLAFAFGMLAMVAITMLVVIVVGMVKVIKLAKQLENLEQQVGREVELIHRHASDVERNMYSEIHDVRRHFDKYTDDLRRELMGYTDSRFDKVQSKIATTTTDVATTKKQLLKD